MNHDSQQIHLSFEFSTSRLLWFFSSLGISSIFFSLVVNNRAQISFAKETIGGNKNSVIQSSWIDTRTLVRFTTT